MANAINTGDIIAKEALAIIENQLVISKNINREYKKEWDKKRDFSIGDQITVTKPARFVGRTGKNASIEDYKEEPVTIKLDKQIGVDVAFDSAELVTDFNIENFSEKVLKPQVSFLANQIDLEVAKLALSVANAVGTPATTPSALKTYLQAGAKLSNFGAPTSDRGIVLNPLAQVEIVDGLKGLFNSTTQIKSQYEDGAMGRAAGFDWAMSQSIYTHTVGPLGGTPLVNGAGQTGSSLVTDGWTAAAALRLNKGDVFTIADVYAVNPITKQSTGELQQFVVTANASSSAAGAATIAISPAIVTTGATKNVTAAPADNASITVLGAANAVTPINLAYHKEAFALVTADLPLPKGMEIAGRAASPKTGISVRFVRGYDINSDKFISRLDVLFGCAVLREEWACRVQG